MNATEIIARLIDSKAINGEEAMCLSKNITLTKEEKEITIDAWVARNKNNVLCLFKYKPYKRDVAWDCSLYVEPMLIESKFFPEVKWEDKEPTKVKLIIEKV